MKPIEIDSLELPELQIYRKIRGNAFDAEVGSGAIDLSDMKNIPQKWVVIMGHEERGLDSKILALCDHIVQIEMEPNIKSFNVSIAASIVMYWLARQ